MKSIFPLFFTLLPLLTQGNERGTVVCVHGFMGFSFEMKYFEHGLKKEGWAVFNWSYPSREHTIQEHAIELVKELLKLTEKDPSKPIYFVGYSMGALIIRAALNIPDCPYMAKIGKAVLLGPPNNGASFGRMLAKMPFTAGLAKEFAGKELMTAENFDYLGEFPITTDVLIIAGNLTYNPFIEGANDGTVAIEETFLSTPHIHRVLFIDHKMMIIHPTALALTCSFFNHEEI